MAVNVYIRIILPVLTVSMIVWTVATSCSTTTKSGSCKPDWFGSRCQYKCRCENNTCISRYNGTCRAGYKCQGGWFGPECQYADLVYNATNVITDGNDTTCDTQYTFSLTVPFNRSFFLGYNTFTWMRVVLSEPWSERFFIDFNVESSNDFRFTPCKWARNFTVDRKTLDVYCDIPEIVESVKLYGHAVSYLCSVYVSGGRNVALGQATSQTGSSANPRLKQECQSEDCLKSSCAVDGDTSDVTRDSCTYTESDGEAPTWIINFTTPVQIIRKVIYNYYKSKNAVETLVNYTMTDFNSHHTSLWIDNNTSIYNYKARWKQHIYVFILRSVSSSTIKPYVNQNRTHKMSVCEIEVYGDYDCQRGWYGKECQEKCDCADNSECFVSTGICMTGCPQGYQGNTCNQACLKNTYGRNCNQNCSQFCYGSSDDSTVCDRYTGSCFYGCQSGYDGARCLTTCEKDKYGPDCSSQCSANCIRRTSTTSSCNRTTGQCFDGCQDGYLDDKCETACQSYMFGPGCNSTCSQYCNWNSYLPPCNNTNGYCLHGCHDGYQGAMCNKTCKHGFYGKGCRSPCSQNCLERSLVSSTCNHINGKCVAGCKDGFIGDMCDEPCDSGFFGAGCEFQCSHNCRLMAGQTFTCNNTNGHCLDGCQDGWHGSRCQHACKHGFYGKGCRSPCSQNCLERSLPSSTCNHTNGKCVAGCKDGFIGDMCDEPCNSGFFGAGCKFQCSHNCRLMAGQTLTCNNTNGHCLDGCQDGWHGSRCQYGCDTGMYGRDCSFSCSDFCVVTNNQDDSSCNHITGNCLHGCLPGYLHPHCVVKLTANKEDYTSTFTATNAVSGAAIILLFILLGVTCRKRNHSGSSTNWNSAMKDIPKTKEVYTNPQNTTAANTKEPEKRTPEFESDDAESQNALENVYSNCELH